MSYGMTVNNVYTLDLSIPRGRSSSVGTTFYFSPQQFMNRMDRTINNIGQAFSKAWYAFPIIPQTSSFYY